MDLSHTTRWRLPVVLAVTIVVNYLDRNNLALALPRMAQEFGWSDREIGANGELLLAAFFLAYGLSNMLLSPFAERLGPKRSLMLAITGFSLVTLMVAPLGSSLPALLGLRLLLGLAEGVHIPMISALTSRWFLPAERSRANAIWGSGILLATAVAPLAIVPCVQALGWRSTFALLGIGGMVLSLPLVQVLLPDDSPRQEQAMPQPIQPQQASQGRGGFWLAVAGGSLNAFCAFGLLNWLPTYFNRAKGIDFEQLGWPLTIVFATGILGMALMAYLGDWLQRRTLLAGVGFFIAGGLVYFASTTQNLPLLVLCFALAVFCQTAYGAQEYAIIQRLLPPGQVGAGTGLYNGLAVLLGGVGGSLVPGSIVAATGSFDASMLSLVVGAWLASLVMVALGRLIRY